MDLMNIVVIMSVHTYVKNVVFDEKINRLKAFMFKMN